MAYFIVQNIFNMINPLRDLIINRHKIEFRCIHPQGFDSEFFNAQVKRGFMLTA